MHKLCIFIQVHNLLSIIANPQSSEEYVYSLSLSQLVYSYVCYRLDYWRVPETCCGCYVITGILSFFNYEKLAHNTLLLPQILDRGQWTCKEVNKHLLYF